MSGSGPRFPANARRGSGGRRAGSGVRTASPAPPLRAGSHAMRVALISPRTLTANDASRVGRPGLSTPQPKETIAQSRLGAPGAPLRHRRARRHIVATYGASFGLHSPRAQPWFEAVRHARRCHRSTVELIREQRLVTVTLDGLATTAVIVERPREHGRSEHVRVKRCAPMLRPRPGASPASVAARWMHAPVEPWTPPSRRTSILPDPSRRSRPVRMATQQEVAGCTLCAVPARSTRTATAAAPSAGAKRVSSMTDPMASASATTAP
jgi:hypothetical protein